MWVVPTCDWLAEVLIGAGLWHLKCWANLKWCWINSSSTNYSLLVRNNFNSTGILAPTQRAHHNNPHWTSTSHAPHRVHMPTKMWMSRQVCGTCTYVPPLQNSRMESLFLPMPILSLIPTILSPLVFTPFPSLMHMFLLIHREREEGGRRRGRQSERQRERGEGERGVSECVIVSQSMCLYL